jgi:RND family efflux transporter MFP subunit
MKPIRWFGSIAAALAACGGEQPPAPPAATPSASGYEVHAETLAVTIPVEGSVTARQRADISTRMMARVSDVPADLGSRVCAGETLIRLGIEDVAANRAKAEAAVQVARAARDEAARQAARMDTLYAQDAVALVQRDGARLGLTAAESQLAMAEATLREVESAAGYARIVAPFDGVVVARSVDPGDLAAPGQPLLVLESAGARDAVIAVPADVAAGLGVGGLVTVEAPDGRTTEGRIRVMAGGADPMTRTVEARVAVPADWPTGVSVTALVPAGTRLAVAIPASAVVRRGQLTGVNVLTTGGPTLRWVRLGRAVGQRVEVLSGLEPGERIAP